MKFHQKKSCMLYETEYLVFKQTDFMLQKSGNQFQKGSWTFVERTKQTSAVVIIPYIKATQEILLIRQFRVPFWKYVIEFPAGLIEEGEAVSSAALRELKEETGYTGTIVYQSPVLAVSAGLTNETASYCLVKVDSHSLENQNLDPVEDIQVLKVPVKELSKFLQKRRELDDIIDCKVFLTLNMDLFGFLQEE